MNWKFAFFITLVALIISIVWGLQRSNTPPTKPNEVIDQPTPAIADTTSYDPIPVQYAKPQIDSFQTYIDNLWFTRKDNKIGTDTSDIDDLYFHGFKVNWRELIKIQDSIAAKSDIYLMLAIKDAKPGSKRPREIDTYILVKPKNSGLANPDDWLYFDFTEPCPTSCPW
ncbi:MAG: hypothetical protein ACK4TA_17140 [Saprospiraceae bacterium]